jgi:hypothetical protein
MNNYQRGAGNTGAPLIFQVGFLMQIKFSMMLLALLIAPACSLAEPKVAISAALDVSDLRQGHDATLAVVMDVPDGYHAQSNTPADDSAIKCELKLDATPGIEFAAPNYPAGIDQQYPDLGKLNVYVGRTIIHVPLKIAADAKLDSIKISGKVTLQICDDHSCFAPVSDPFSIDAKIVPESTAVTATNPELFTTKSKESAKPATQP